MSQNGECALLFPVVPRVYCEACHNHLCNQHQFITLTRRSIWYAYLHQTLPYKSENVCPDVTKQCDSTTFTASIPCFVQRLSNQRQKIVPMHQTYIKNRCDKLTCTKQHTMTHKMCVQMSQNPDIELHLPVVPHVSCNDSQISV